MRTTIDAAGRVVIPKGMRDAMGLTAGREIDVVYAEGRIEIELAPVAVDVEKSEGELPRLVARGQQPPLSDEDVRSALDSVRR